MSDSKASQSRGRSESTGSAAGSTQRLTVLYVVSLSAIALLAHNAAFILQRYGK